MILGQMGPKSFLIQRKDKLKMVEALLSIVHLGWSGIPAGREAVLETRGAVPVVVIRVRRDHDAGLFWARRFSFAS